MHRPRDTGQPLTSGPTDLQIGKAVYASALMLGYRCQTENVELGRVLGARIGIPETAVRGSRLRVITTRWALIADGSAARVHSAHWRSLTCDAIHMAFRVAAVAASPVFGVPRGSISRT